MERMPHACQLVQGDKVFVQGKIAVGNLEREAGRIRGRKKPVKTSSRKILSMPRIRLNNPAPIKIVLNCWPIRRIVPIVCKFPVVALLWVPMIRGVKAADFFRRSRGFSRKSHKGSCPFKKSGIDDLADFSSLGKPISTGGFVSDFGSSASFQCGQIRAGGKRTRRHHMTKRSLRLALFAVIACCAAIGSIPKSASAAGEGQPSDWQRFYYYPYVYYPQNFQTPQQYDSLYYRYPKERRIPVYNKDWYNFYPTEKPWYKGHHFILDVF